jgi:glucose-1-phosphate adenylyltransferase
MQVGSSWYKGTADAIRQNMSFIERARPRQVLVLPGDHIYKMNYGVMRRFHDEAKACLSVSVVRVPAAQARGAYGVLEVADDGRVLSFEEKPQQPRTIPGTDECYASMGVYIFNYETLARAGQRPRGLRPGGIPRWSRRGSRSSPSTSPPATSSRSTSSPPGTGGA